MPLIAIVTAVLGVVSTLYYNMVKHTMPFVREIFELYTSVNMNMPGITRVAYTGLTIQVLYGLRGLGFRVRVEGVSLTQQRRALHSGLCGLCQA